MKMTILSLLLLVGVFATAVASTTAVAPNASADSARWVLHSLKLARGYGSCSLRCEDQFRACMATASTPEAQRSCRLQQNLCISDCNRYMGR